MSIKSVIPSSHLILCCPLFLLPPITTNWKILKEMGIPGHPTCLLRNLYAGQEATVKTGHGTLEPMDFPSGSKLGKDYIKVALLI